MILTVEFFLGLIAAFIIGYLIASALEKHISLEFKGVRSQ